MSGVQAVLDWSSSEFCLLNVKYKLVLPIVLNGSNVNATLPLYSFSNYQRCTGAFRHLGSLAETDHNVSPDTVGSSRRLCLALHRERPSSLSHHQGNLQVAGCRHHIRGELLSNHSDKKNKSMLHVMMRCKRLLVLREPKLAPTVDPRRGIPRTSPHFGLLNVPYEVIVLHGHTIISSHMRILIPNSSTTDPGRQN